MSKSHPLAAVRLFQGLADEQLAAIEGAGEYREYAEGETLFQEGDEGTHMYALLDGRVQLSVALRNVTEQVPVHVSTPGSVFGEFVLFERLPRSATAGALKPTRVFVATAEELETVFSAAPEVGLTVMRNLCRILVDRMRKTTTELRASLTW
jgi:CRP-like cAMP-binding protein